MRLAQFATLKSRVACPFVILKYLHKNISVPIRAGQVLLCCTELVIPSCIVATYHVYGEVWTAVLGKQLVCECEIGNVVD